MNPGLKNLFFFQAEDGIRDRSPSRGLGDVYKRQQVIDGKFGRVLSWYDNEWGFSNRMCDTAVAMKRSR